MQVTNLSGFSGCKILLCEDDQEHLFVRKISPNIEYNSRLVVQMEKQIAFSSDVIKTPEVYNSGYEEGLFYFDMEYIRGITLSEKIKTMRIDEIRKYSDTLINEIIVQDAKDNNASNAFIKKIEDLKVLCSIRKNEVLDQAIEMLEKYNWERIPCSVCHGDLTMENIIIHDNRCYLIDFLDSFYNSWVFDVATLLQDTQCFWSYRNDSRINNNTLLRLMIFNDLILENVKERNSKRIMDIYYVLLLKLVRVYPYCKNIDIEEFLKGKILMTVKIINERLSEI